jgi:hypothetical protein
MAVGDACPSTACLWGGSQASPTALRRGLRRLADELFFRACRKTAPASRAGAAPCRIRAQRAPGCRWPPLPCLRCSIRVDRRRAHRAPCGWRARCSRRVFRSPRAFPSFCSLRLFCIQFLHYAAGPHLSPDPAPAGMLFSPASRRSCLRLPTACGCSVHERSPSCVVRAR